MGMHHRILGAAYQPARVANDLGLGTRDRLRVLLYHDIPDSEMERFAAQLRWLSRQWRFVSPDRFGAMMSGDEPIRGRNLLVSFDDGFLSNRHAAERVLNPLRIHAMFFAVPAFVAIEDRDEARRFIAKNVQPGSRAEDLPAHWENMRWPDLEALLEQGHTIGAHTATHARLSTVTESARLRAEIVESADVLADRLGIAVDHFAYTFGDIGSVTPEALSLARSRFRFVHSGLRGNNVGATPFTIRRDSAALQDSRSNYQVFSNVLLGAFLEGVADRRYAASRRTLDAWSRS